MSNELQNKIKHLESTNKKLIEEYNALNRNYETICNKYKEEKNLTKRLQDELSLSINKEKKDELTQQLNTYREKYERLANSINGLESKLKSASQNNIKYQENELNYKKQIKLLEEKIRNNQHSSLSSKKIAKQNEEKISLYRQENQKLEKINKELLLKNEETNKKIIDTNIIYEQMKKENEIIYKLLEDSRAKLKETQKMFENLKEKMNLNKNHNNDNKYQQLYNDALNTINTLKNQINLLESDNEFYKGLQLSNKNEANKKLEIININENKINLLGNNKIYFDKISNIFQENNNIFNQYDLNIKNKMNLLDEKINTFHDIILDKLNNLLENLKKTKQNKINNKDEELLNDILKLKLENSKLNTEIKKYENKLNKKKQKKLILLKEIEELNEKNKKLIEKEKNSVDLSEIRKQFKYINEITQRLQLTMETFSINLKCKNCYKIKTKMFQLSCGHSICNECIKNEQKCAECEREFDVNLTVENKFLSNTIARYNYAEQQINGDIGLVIQTLKVYLK